MTNSDSTASLARFDQPVPPDGYAWWYLDAVSDDGVRGLTLIAFVGSVFSPHYARARRRGPTDPLDFCALNVALYGGGTTRWALSEYRDAAVVRDRRQLNLGGSVLRLDDARLRIEIDEVCAPLPRRLRGVVDVELVTRFDALRTLDPLDRHAWSVLAPFARVRVNFETPALRWQGSAYVDHNRGAVPLERDLSRWTWLRTVEPGRTTVLYDVVDRLGGERAHALRFDSGGQHDELSLPLQMHAVPRTLWGVQRPVRGDAEAAPQVISTLEDTPFYSRSLVRTRIGGQDVQAMHESLDLERFAAAWVQRLLPFKTRRARRG